MPRRRRRPAPTLDTRGRSTLAGKQGKYVGVGFGPHPLKVGWSIQIMVFYYAPENFYIGLADVEGPGDLLTATLQLGTELDLGEVAPWIHRGVEGKEATLTLVKELFKDKVASGYTFRWLDESKL